MNGTNGKMTRHLKGKSLIEALGKIIQTRENDASYTRKSLSSSEGVYIHNINFMNYSVSAVETINVLDDSITLKSNFSKEPVDINIENKFPWEIT